MIKNEKQLISAQKRINLLNMLNTKVEEKQSRILKKSASIQNEALVKVIEREISEYGGFAKKGTTKKSI